jgi:hypothetical protein
MIFMEQVDKGDGLDYFLNLWEYNRSLILSMKLDIF